RGRRPPLSASAACWRGVRKSGRKSVSSGPGTVAVLTGFSRGGGIGPCASRGRCRVNGRRAISAGSRRPEGGLLRSRQALLESPPGEQLPGRAEVAEDVPGSPAPRGAAQTDWHLRTKHFGRTFAHHLAQPGEPAQPPGPAQMVGEADLPAVHEPV